MRIALSVVVGLLLLCGGANAAEQKGPDLEWEKHNKCGPWEGIRPTSEQIKVVLKAHGELVQVLYRTTQSELSRAQRLDPRRANFCGANLNGVNLSKADLTEANLSEADLLTANFSGANLSRADLSGATLYKAKLSGADLSRADLSGAWLTETNLSGARLAKTNLSGADLSGADLSGAPLYKANLSGAKLYKANFTKANLREANLTKADLREANLTKADLREATLSKANLYKAILSGADLFVAELSGANLSKADLREADFEQATLRGAKLYRADFTAATLRGTDLKDALFADVILTDAVYEPISAPEPGSLGGLDGLEEIKFNKSSGLTLLRAALKEAGQRDLERLATYLLQRHERRNAWQWDDDAATTKNFQTITENPVGFLVAGLNYVFFEITSEYGRAYMRPLGILLALILVFSVPYMFSVASKGAEKSGIWREWPDDWLIRRKTAADEKPQRTTATGWRIVTWGFYFSLLSAFHIGWRDLNVGSWIARMQPHEYRLRAAGWVRVVSGVQSLISVYLVALWALTTFTRPFG